MGRERGERERERERERQHETIDGRAAHLNSKACPPQLLNVVIKR